MAETQIPVQFKNIYLSSNHDGMKRLLEHKFGERAKEFDTIDIYQMILAIVDEACTAFLDTKEMKRRLAALEEGTIRTGNKDRVPMDKYFAVMSGLQHSTVYCAEDKKTGKLISSPLSSRDDTVVTYIALDKKFETARYKSTGKVLEMKMDDFILRCLDEGIEGFAVDIGDSCSFFSVEKYEEEAVTFMSARKIVNSVIGDGISGDLLFPALATYLNHMLVDVRKKDGTEFTGYFVSLLDNFSTMFMVLDTNGEESIIVDEGELEWLKVHMTSGLAED